LYQSLRSASRRRSNLNSDDKVLFDDRDMTAGEKFAEADLIGAPIRIIISEKSLAAGGAEIVDLKSEKTEIIAIEKISSINFEK